MSFNDLSKSQFVEIKDEWARAVDALEQAQVLAAEARLAYRTRFSDAAKHRMKFALEVRDAAEARLRGLIQLIWKDV